MKRLYYFLILFLFVNILLFSEVIEKIVIEGNKKVSRDTVLFYMRSREGGVYTVKRLREDFKSLWGTGFFEDIKIDSEDGEKGKVVSIKLKEHKLISTIMYKTGKKITESDIVEKLQENNIVLMPFSHFSPVKIKRVERIIKEMLLEKGYSDGKVEIDIREDKGQVGLVVNVIQGMRTRIGAVEFPGLDKSKVSSSFVRRGLKNNKVHSLFSAIGGKDVYNKEKIGEDLEGIKLRLQERGYLESKVGKPSFSMFIRKDVLGGVRKMLRILIPVELGPRYVLGKVKIEGNKVIKTSFLRHFITLKQNKVYNIKKRNKNIDDMLKFYRSLGYFYCQVVPVEDLDPVKRVSDLTLRIMENEVAYLGKLDFFGNTFTKDHVIRREWFLREGGRFNVDALETSIRRMKQLGLVTIDKMPDIKPDSEDPQKINIRCEVKELNRQMINFSTGYSGFDGWFIALGYQTQNFMGLGETFAINFQKGTRSQNYRFAFTEPYIFNLRASLGIDVHKTSFKYPYLYTRDGEGFNISTAFRLFKFWGSSLIYSFERIDISDVNQDIGWTNPLSQFYYQPGKRTISSFSPTIYYSTVDSPIFPSTGTKYLFNYRYSGGVLGGDIDLHKTRFEFVKFIPLFKRRHTLGLHAVHMSLMPFGGTPVPFYEKYFLGGERSIRGFDIYRIGPKNEEGYVIGGSKAFYLNFEYQVPLNQQFAFVLFYDVGNAYDFGEPMNFKDVYSSIGLELKVFVPMLGVPFRLIFSYNHRKLREVDSNFVFRFAVGPSFN